MNEEKKFIPFVPANVEMKEFTIRAALLGAIMAMLMGAANAYLGLKAGMTIAATYTTAIIGMAVLKALKGTILEENAARTIGFYWRQYCGRSNFCFTCILHSFYLGPILFNIALYYINNYTCSSGNTWNYVCNFTT